MDSTLHLVRHAQAGKRSQGSEDLLRPLDADGNLQAQSLACALAAESERGPRINSVLSSPAIRCQQTVAPLAERLGLAVEVRPALWEGESSPALAIVDQLVAAEATAVLCSHGDIIPAILDALVARGLDLGEGGCGKGSVWSLGVSGGEVQRARYVSAKKLRTLFA